MWSCESLVKNELSQKEAMNLAKRINPFISKQDAKKDYYGNKLAKWIYLL